MGIDLWAESEEDSFKDELKRYGISTEQSRKSRVFPRTTELIVYIGTAVIYSLIGLFGYLSCQHEAKKRQMQPKPPAC